MKNLVLILAVSISSSISNAADEICGENMEFQYLGSGRAACLRTIGNLPIKGNARPYCNWLKDGYLGFLWDINEANKGFKCPYGMRMAPNDAGQNYCLIDDVKVPPNFIEICTMLFSRTILGFEFSIK
jgi:hypothetical protein